MKTLLLILALSFGILSCSESEQVQNSNVLQVGAPEKQVSERSIEFPVQDKQKIKAQILETAESSKKVATFTPAVKRTDGNLYMISLTLLAEIYGKERGMIQLTDAKTKPFAGGTYACWDIYNPAQEFCIAPVAKSDTDKSIAAAAFFVE